MNPYELFIDRLCRLHYEETAKLLVESGHPTLSRPLKWDEDADATIKMCARAAMGIILGEIMREKFPHLYQAKDVTSSWEFSSGEEPNGIKLSPPLPYLHRSNDGAVVYYDPHGWRFDTKTDPDV